MNAFYPAAPPGDVLSEFFNLSNGGSIFPPAVRVYGNCLDRFSGAPIAGVTITIDLYEERVIVNHGLPCGPPSMTVVSDENGHYEFEDGIIPSSFFSVSPKDPTHRLTRTDPNSPNAITYFLRIADGGGDIEDMVVQK